MWILCWKIYWEGSHLHIWMQKLNMAIHYFLKKELLSFRRKLATNTMTQATNDLVSSWIPTWRRSIYLQEFRALEFMSSLSWDNVKSTKFFPKCGEGFGDQWETAPASTSKKQQWMGEGGFVTADTAASGVALTLPCNLQWTPILCHGLLPQNQTWKTY